MDAELSYARLVRRVVSRADRPLTLAEIRAGVERERAVATANPEAALRTAISSIPLIATLGGRPAHYTWWPRHLQGNTFRQPLQASNLAAGTLALSQETWMALWPDFFDGAGRSAGTLLLILEGGPTLPTRISPPDEMRPAWGIAAAPALAAWYRRQGALPADDLIVRVLDVETRRYAVSLDRRSAWDDAKQQALIERNLAWAETAMAVLRTARFLVPDFALIPRLVAHGAYSRSLPPDPWDAVLRADLRFVAGKDEAGLAGRVVASLERDPEIASDGFGSPRPPGRLPALEARGAQAYPAAVRRAWAAYLFDRGLEYLDVGWDYMAEAYYKTALQLDPGHADAWVHVGNRRFEEGHVAEALACYERAIALAETRTVGEPERYPDPFWLDVVSRPFMRALHGCGLCLWRLGQVADARQVFERMLALNPNDNQGARFLLADLDEGLSWEESSRRDRKWGGGGR